MSELTHTAGPWEPREIEGSSAIFFGDFRLCIDPSVPTEMILFPDDETRKWFCERLKENDALDKTAHDKTMEIIALTKLKAELLSALTQLLEGYKGWNASKCRDDARAAIAKAEGK